MTAVHDKDFDIEDLDEEALAYSKDTVEEKSGLAQLAEDVEGEVSEPTRLRHPGIPAYVLIFKSNIPSAEAISVEKRTKNSKAQVRDRNALFLALANLGIEKDGATVENSKGDPINFRDPDFLNVMGAKTAAGAVVRFLKGNDGWLIALADKVAAKAGYGTEVEEVTDPT